MGVSEQSFGLHTRLNSAPCMPKGGANEPFVSSNSRTSRLTLLVTTLPTTDAGVAPAVLQTQGFGLCFGSRLILAGVELSLPTGGVDVVMGPARAGKSTLVRAMAGRYTADPHCRQWGQVSMAGHPLTDSWRPTLVQQQAQVAKVSLREALALPSRGQPVRTSQDWTTIAEEVLSQHGLAALAKDMNGPVARLTPSRQRAVNILAHAMLGAPLLMVDEPTYGLADGEALWLVAWLAALGRRVRLLVVLQHQGHARRLADRVVLLGGGRVLAHENAARFFSQPPNSYAAQFVRTGDLTIAAPDANPDQLPVGLETPPILPSSVWSTLLAMRARFGGGVEEPPPERQLRDFHTQPGELSDTQLGELTHSQSADLDPLQSRGIPPVPSTAAMSAPHLPARPLPTVTTRNTVPPPFAAPDHRLSGADFSDTIPGARLDMTPVMPPRAALGPQGLRSIVGDVHQRHAAQAPAPHDNNSPSSSTPGETAAAVDAESTAVHDESAPAADHPWPDTESQVVQRWANLPPVSQAGAEDAAAVGRVILVDHRGPVGFHWLVPGKLAGCAEPGAQATLETELALLAGAGVHMLITLTERDLDPAALARHRLSNLHVPIADRQAPSIAQAYMLASRIQRLMDQGLTVAVHCKSGIGRTGVVLAAWMMREGGYSVASALQRLRRVNPAYVRTPDQEGFLLAFEQDLFRRTR